MVFQLLPTLGAGLSASKINSSPRPVHSLPITRIPPQRIQEKPWTAKTRKILPKVLKSWNAQPQSVPSEMFRASPSSGAPPESSPDHPRSVFHPRVSPDNPWSAKPQGIRRESNSRVFARAQSQRIPRESPECVPCLQGGDGRK